MTQRRVSLWVLILMLGLSTGLPGGCMLGPNFKPPEADVPEGWAGGPEAPAAAAMDAEEELARWWTFFNDPILLSLEERAVQSNLDLQLAGARIRQARAALQGAQGGLGPTVDATGDYRRSRAPVTSSRGGDTRSSGVVSSQYQAGFDAGWEIDIFGGVRRTIEASGADLQAAVEGRRDVVVTLTAEVARNYIDLRSFQQRIVIARKNLAVQEHSAKITRQRFEGGFVSGLDVANAEAQVASTISLIPALEASARQAIYSLGILLGLPPAALMPELSPEAAIPIAPPPPPAGVPSDLLRRRPDIRRAEAQIHAETARIGVVTADLFPKISLSGSIGLQAADLDQWLTWGQRFWSFGPSVSWRVFDMGRTRAAIEQQEAVQEQSLIAYRQTVLEALQETENALIASVKEQERRQALGKAVSANRKAVGLATTLYTEGQTDFLSVLDAQRSLFLTEDSLVQSAGAVATDLVALFKALGGGWRHEQEEAGGISRK
jgi:NodT family efflux transporter outer membrane factor (OMF) lipoprotein